MENCQVLTRYIFGIKIKWYTIIFCEKLNLKCHKIYIANILCKFEF